MGLRKALSILMTLIILICGMDIMHDTVQGKESTREEWTATSYTDEDGYLIDGLEEAVNKTGKKYWLETTDPMQATITVNSDEIILRNEAVERIFSLPAIGEGGFYTKSYKNLYTEKQLVTGQPVPDMYIGLYDKSYGEVYNPVSADVGTWDGKPEVANQAIKIDPDYYYVGGNGQSHTFVLKSYTIYDECIAPFEWKPHTIYGDPASEPWPPKGKRLEVVFEAPDSFPEAYRGIEIKAIYEIYDNLATIKKTVEITNTGSQSIMVGKLATEVLDVEEDKKELMYIQTNYIGGSEATVPVVNNDQSYLKCRCQYEKDTSPFKELHNKTHTCYDVGPAYTLKQGEAFKSFDAYELFYSTYWNELRGRERLGMMRKVFPWITDNPLTYHHTGRLTKNTINHAMYAGFEMIIQSYGSYDVGNSNSMLTRDKGRLDYYKELIDYAHSKGIAIGFYQAQYTLGQYKEGNNNTSYGGNHVGGWDTWCMASTAFDDYWDNFKYFLEYTGADCVEIDGCYPTTFCNHGEDHVNKDRESDPNPAGTDKLGGTPSKYAMHQGYFDSKVKQWENAQRTMNNWFKENDIYVKVPAWYYGTGGNKGTIGYEEIAWSAPRHEQLIYGRQVIHASGYAKSPSMSWSHIPFSNYHGGGSQAAFLPFKDHQEDYNWVLAQNMGNGITSDFRGTALYDDESAHILNKWVSFYKKYRGIANSDLIHINQADYDETPNIPNPRQRTIKMDTLFHANATNGGEGGEKGLLWVYNQTDEARTETIRVPMYYTGLTGLTYPQVPALGSLPKPLYRYDAGKRDWTRSFYPQREENYTLPAPTATAYKADFLKNGINLEQVTIDSNGYANIQVTLQPMSFAYYTVYGPDKSPSISVEIGAVAGVKQKEVTENSVTLTWDAKVPMEIRENGVLVENPNVNVDYYEIYRDEQLIDTSRTNTYTDSKLQESTTYAYEIRAIMDGASGIKSSTVTVTTSPDHRKPTVLTARATSDRTIEITFSEGILESDLLDKSHYIISNRQIKDMHKISEEAVRLTLETSLEPFVSYSLTLKNMRDLSVSQNRMEDATLEIKYGLIRSYPFESIQEGKVYSLENNKEGITKNCSLTL